jgi:hypothetical protein
MGFALSCPCVLKKLKMVVLCYDITSRALGQMLLHNHVLHVVLCITACVASIRKRLLHAYSIHQYRLEQAEIGEGAEQNEDWKRLCSIRVDEMAR